MSCDLQLAFILDAQLVNAMSLNIAVLKLMPLKYGPLGEPPER